MNNGAVGEAILGAQSVVKSFGMQPVLQGISLTIHEGERVGLIGRNGSGKSTLLNILAGRDQPDEGLVTRRQGLRVGLLDQECRRDPSLTIRELLEEASGEIRVLLDEHEALAQRMAVVAADSDEYLSFHARYDHLHHQLDLADAWNLARDIKQVTLALDLPEPGRVLGTLSGGELRRADLAAVLLAHPDVLLLDEPTNHIDTKSVEWMESFLVNYPGSCVLVTHDRYFLEQVVSRIVEIEFNRIYSFPGNYRRFLEYKTQLKDVEMRTDASRRGILRRELTWLQRGPKARATKQKARINRYHELAEQEGPAIRPDLVFEIPAPPRLGKRIVDAEDATFAYGQRVLFKNFSLILQKGMRIGILGPSGCGKTTLLRVLMAQEEPKKGRVLIGESTQFLYVDQTHEEINPDKSILDFVSEGSHYWDVNERRLYIPSYLERFLFDRASINMPMRNLSGGERNRIQMAKKLLRGGNVLVLYEPTNDLDLPTLRIIEEAVEAFDGCALIVSHDRYFLNRLCTHVIVFEPDNPVLLFTAGNYDDYLIYKEKQLATANANKPEKSAPKREQTPRDPRRLTYKERLEFESIEQAIGQAENDLRTLDAAITSPEFYNQDYAAVHATLQKHIAARKRVEDLYARWQELDERQNL